MTYLEQALSTERFLSSNQIDTDDGISWRRVPEGRSTHSLYHGSAGVMLFYIEIYFATDDVSYLEIAQKAGNNLLAYVEKKAAAKAFITIGFYSGWPGYVYALNELYKVTHDTRYQNGAKLALDRITAQSSKIGSGIGWIEPIPFSDITGIEGEREVIDLSVGAAGAGIIYLYAYREGLLDDTRLAEKTADRLLEVGENTPEGIRWLMMTDMPFPFTAPNFAHGGAGVGYFLADLYRETKHENYLEAAVSAAEYVKTRTVTAGDGILVCHTEEQQPPSTFYLGVCHGPAGTGRFMYLLGQITGDGQYMNWIGANFKGLLSTGAPTKRSKGLWQNYSQCCGDAGIGDYALFLHHATGDDSYLNYAKQTAEQIVSQGNHAPGLCWQTAEHRDRRDFLESQTGYMQGAAGVASFLLHLDSVLANKPVKLIMPETPFSY
ncbi:MAG: lantibiotic modifying enzyme [Granulosicoccus sp.]|jgi:lantibiotic modifying enzyme